MKHIPQGSSQRSRAQDEAGKPGQCVWLVVQLAELEDAQEPKHSKEHQDTLHQDESRLCQDSIIWTDKNEILEGF